jgi:hypothetical protein
MQRPALKLAAVGAKKERVGNSLSLCGLSLPRVHPAKPLEKNMRSIKYLLAPAATIMALAVLAPSLSQAQEWRPLTASKECSQFTGTAPSFCTITDSNFRPLKGAIVRYFGPELGAHGFVDSSVVLEAKGGGTAFGHCLVRLTPEPLGACEFTGGSGSLQGFIGDVTVTVSADGIWHFKGAILTGE